MTLELEKRAYEALEGDLLASHEGEFALIKGEELVGTFPDKGTAYAEGLDRFGRQPFLVREIKRDRTINLSPLIGARKKDVA